MQIIKRKPVALPEPEVWWGESGIDALLWADGRPYDKSRPAVMPEVEASDASAVIKRDLDGQMPCR
jgi:hypothetical protein